MHAGDPFNASSTPRYERSDSRAPVPVDETVLELHESVAWDIDVVRKQAASHPSIDEKMFDQHVSPVGGAHVEPLAHAEPLGSPRNALLRFFIHCKRVKAFQATAIGGAADVVAQISSSAPQLQSGLMISSLNWRQTLVMALWAFQYNAGTRQFIDRCFDKWFGAGSSARSVALKLFTELFVYAPLVYIPCFYMFVGLLLGQGWSGSVQALSLKFLPTLKAHLAIWLVPMLVYFAWIPENSRVIFRSSCSFVQKILYSLLAMSPSK
jgi:hypothetical protein